MTDRDTFAAAALTGLLANGDYSVESIPMLAYRMADAMLRESGVTEPLPKEKRAEVSFALTNDERGAVKLAADFLEDEFYGCSDKCAAEHNAVATLRKLLERLA